MSLVTAVPRCHAHGMTHTLTLTLPATGAEEAILDRAIQGRHAIEAALQAADDSPRLAGSPDALAELVLTQAGEVADGLRAGDAAQATVDALALLLAVAEEQVGVEAVRHTAP